MQYRITVDEIIIRPSDPPRSPPPPKKPTHRIYTIHTSHPNSCGKKRQPPKSALIDIDVFFIDVFFIYFVYGDLECPGRRLPNKMYYIVLLYWWTSGGRSPNPFKHVYYLTSPRQNSLFRQRRSWLRAASNPSVLCAANC